MGIPVKAVRELCRDWVRRETCFVGGIIGFVFSTGDTRSLSEHLELLLSDPVLRSRFGQKSRGTIEHWTYRENVNGILMCLDELANAKREA